MILAHAAYSLRLTKDIRLFVRPRVRRIDADVDVDVDARARCDAFGCQKSVEKQHNDNDPCRHCATNDNGRMMTRAMMTTPVMHRASATTKTTAVKAAVTTTTRPTMLMKMTRRSVPVEVTTTTTKTKMTNVATRAMPMDGIEHVERLVATTADAETVALTYGSIGLVVASIGYFVWKAFGSMLVGPSATASHVLVKSESEALKLKEEIESEVKAGAPLGAKFASVAGKHSTCPSAKKGGELGTFKPGQMVKEFDTVVFTGPIGQVLGPVNTQFGSHLILITSRDEK